VQTAIGEYFGELRSLAELLERPDLARRVDIMAAQAETGKATLLIIGCSGNGRCSVANRLLGEENLLPVAPDKATAPLRVTYGQADVFTVRSAAGLPLNAASRQELHELYRKAGAALESVSLQSGSELLKRCDLLVESLDAVRPVTAWRELVAGVDYVLLVTSGLAALNERERTFVTEAVAPTLGVSRLGVLINQMDLVSEQEAVLDYVKASFRSLGEPRLVVACSAGKGGKKGQDPEVAALQQVLPEKVLPAITADLRSGPAGSLGGKLALWFDALEATAREREQLAGLDLTRIDRQIQNITATEALAEKRAATMRAQVDVMVNLIVREDFLHHVHQFRLAFSEALEEAVAEETNLLALRRNLPGYIEAVWQEFLTVRQARTREEITARLAELQALAEQDLRQMLGPDYAETSSLLDGFKAGPDHVRQLIPHAKGKSTAGTVASTLKWAGALLVVIFPPGGGGLYVLGEIVGRWFRGDIQAADRRALLAKARESLENVERQITAAVISHFDELETELSAMLAEYYTGRLEQLRTGLEAARDQILALHANQSRLKAVLESDCPRLRRQAAALLAAVHA
jgi:rRNA-processing protein FCF1